jgi:transposase
VREGRVRGLVAHHRRGPVHQDQRLRAGSPPVLGRDACRTPGQLEQASGKIAARIIEVSGADVSSVALDMTNFATFIATGNPRAPIAHRGKAKQKRTDLRLVGLGLVGTRDGGLPLTWHAYPGDKPDVTQLPGMIDALKTQYE